MLWWTNRRQLDSVHFTFFVKPGATASIMARLALAQSLFDAVDGQYGYPCDREEHYARCMVDAWPSSSGRLQGGRAVGTDRHRHLPALFWANFFGPAHGALLGASRFAAAPAYETTKGTRSWRLLTAASPAEWELPSTLACIDGLRAYVGGDLFYSREHPDRLTRAPSFALAKATPRE